MKRSKSLTSIGLLFVFLILTTSLGSAQGPDPDPEVQSTQAMRAGVTSVPRTIPIQGRLTDNTGTPITGTHNITLTLYTAEDVMMCQNMQSVYANNGLFNTVIDTCTSSDIDGKDLYLGIQVEGDAEMTPRQQIYPVPYAYSLVPGAEISGTLSTYAPIFSVVNNQGNGINIEAVDYGLYVREAGKDGVWVDKATDDGFYVSEAGDVGVYVGNAGNYGVYAKTDSETGQAVHGWANASSGANYGVYGRSDSPDGYGVYGVNYDAGGVAVMADGTGIIKSTADSVIAVSPLKAVIDRDTAHPELIPQGDGTLDLDPTTTGSQYIYIPVDLPAQLFGVEQKLKSFRVCYELSNSNSYLSEVGVYYTKDTGARSALHNDTTNRTSTSWQCYTVTDLSPAVIPNTVFMRFQLYVNDSTHWISIGNIELTLTEN